MMLYALASVFTLTLAAAPPAGGVVAATPLDEVKAFDALLPAALKGEGLSDLLATDAELKQLFLKAGVGKRDVEMLVKNSPRVIDDEDIPQPFTPVIALWIPGDKGSHELRFYDENMYRIDLDVFARAPGRVALSAPPGGERANLADDIEWLHAAVAEGRRKALPTAFSKDAGVWSADTFPGPDVELCRELMHAKAKQIHAAQMAYREKHKQFRGGEKLTSFGDGFMGYSAIEPIDDDHFRAEVGRHGGFVTIDETGVVTDVSPCALTKDAVKAQANKAKQAAKKAKKAKQAR